MARFVELAEEGSPQTRRKVDDEGWQSANAEDGRRRGSAHNDHEESANPQMVS